MLIVPDICAMESNLKYEKHLFICTNQRPENAPSPSCHGEQSRIRSFHRYRPIADYDTTTTTKLLQLIMCILFL